LDSTALAPAFFLPLYESQALSACLFHTQIKTFYKINLSMVKEVNPCSH
jgi:hypothetical protein